MLTIPTALSEEDGVTSSMNIAQVLACSVGKFALGMANAQLLLFVFILARIPQ
jgi:hypothetical protein